jgi:hypothetical protein
MTAIATVDLRADDFQLHLQLILISHKYKGIQS